MHGVDDFGGAIQVVRVHGLAHLLQIGRGHLILVVRIVGFGAGEGGVHGDAVIGLEAGDGVVEGAVL